MSTMRRWLAPARRSASGPSRLTQADLLRELEEPGCPVCRGSRRAGRRYLFGLLWEFVNDGGVRDRLRAAHGFCRDHARTAVDVEAEQGSGLGMALLYDDFLHHVRAEVLAAAADRPQRWWRPKGPPPSAALAAHAACPACVAERRAAERSLGVLATSAEDSEVGRAAGRPDRWLCLPHLAIGLDLATGGEERRRLVSLYLRGEEACRADLREYIRKQDYRFADEPAGREAGSWRWAPQCIVGEGGQHARRGDV